MKFVLHVTSWRLVERYGDEYNQQNSRNTSSHSPI